MRIDRFEVSIGGYGSTNYETTKRRKNLVFRTWVDYPDSGRVTETYLRPEEWSFLISEISVIVRG